MRSRILALWLALACFGAAAAHAQTTPTGTLSGQVSDPDGLALPGVTVTVASPALQGTRDAVTSGNGDYIIPFLPPGDYTVTFAIEGFKTIEQKVRVQVAETVPLNVQMSIGSLQETVTVSAQVGGDFTPTATAASSYKAELIDTLPVSRTLSGAVLLAPGTTNTGPGGNITFSGAMSYEGLFLLNGVVLNETLRGQPPTLFIEDAIEETKTSTANISAEFGRFAGGVANTITKSGGNNFTGSFRTTFTNDSWRNLTPFEEDLPEDPRIDKTVPAYEMTFGGPVLRNQVWFFTAARFEDEKVSETLRYTNIPYEQGTNDKRFQGNGTWSFLQNHTVKGSYTWRERKFTNNTYETVMDRASFYDNSQPEKLISANYTGVIKSNFFVEAQYSARKLSFVGSGSRYTDIARGTIIFDRSRSSARWNSPTFCAVCNVPEGKLNEEKRNNENIIVKGSWFLSTDRAGSHNVVTGFDTFEDMRKNDNWQSGSGFRLYSNNTIIRGETLYPVVIPGTSNTQSSAAYVMWNPIFNPSVGSSLRTYSGFANDVWRLNNHLTFNLGLRWDKTDAKDQEGKQVADDSAWSPRLSATFDPKGDGVWTVNAGFARYAMGATSNIIDLGSGAGRQSTFRYVYRGPAINTDLNTPNPVSAADALTTVFDWFFANGGTGRPLRDSPTYAGVNRKVGENLITPSAWEYTAGVARTIGNKGLVRVDGIFREYRDFYALKKDLTTGRVADPRGTEYDLGIVVNTNDLKRNYKALQTQIQYRFTTDFQMGGNYTLSQARGNFSGETSSDGPIADDFLAYPEYFDPSWGAPMGNTSIDQRHKLRLWANYDWGLGRAGRLNIGVLERVTSGQPSSLDASISIGAYVKNPGYLTPPTSTTYYFGGRGTLETDTVSATDVSLNYSLPFGFGRSEFFARFVVDNLFNQAALTGFNETINTNATDATLAPFNPFTEQPVEGVHYELGPLFGQATSGDSYQNPRSFYFAVGARF